MTRCEFYDPTTTHQCSRSKSHTIYENEHECLGLQEPVGEVMVQTHQPHRWVIEED